MIAALIARLRALADRRLPSRQRDGRRGEELAYRRLLAEGYTVVARNFRQRGGRGEIDLIGWDGDFLACVEVKTRATADFGRPEAAVDGAKRRMLAAAAHEYARRAGVEPARIRFDIVSVVLEPEPAVELYRDAFSERTLRRRRR